MLLIFLTDERKPYWFFVLEKKLVFRISDAHSRWKNADEVSQIVSQQRLMIGLET